MMFFRGWCCSLPWPLDGATAHRCGPVIATRMRGFARYHELVSTQPPNPDPDHGSGRQTPAAPAGPSALLPAGKVAPDFLAQLIETTLPSEVVLGPRIGEDACAIEIEAGTLVAATDPITLTGAGVGAHAVAVNANDVAVTGARPRWFLACVLLPEGSTREDAKALFAGMRRTLDEVGATLVGGHTEVTGAVRQPLVVGQMLGITTERTVPTGGLRPGDAVVQIGPAPVEGAAVLADILPPVRLAAVSARALEAARSALDSPGILVVEPALVAARAGASALHDPTEGGLSAGLHEMADASGVAIAVKPDRILWFEPGTALCAAAGLDPWGTLASGTLLAGFAPDRVDAAVHDLASAGHRVSVIGRAECGRGVTLVGSGPLARFDRDELNRL